MLPLWDTQPHHRAPVLTALLIVACLAVFGYEVSLMLAGAKGFETWMTTHALVPARWLAGVTDPAQWATVATSMFLHGGVAHVLGNCWFLWVFGNNVEDRLGFFGFGIFYLVSGLVAALAQIAADPGSTVPMVGASGAISGVLGAYLIFFPRSWVVALVPWIVPVLPVPAVVFLVLWFVVQAYAGVGSLLAGSSGAGGVAWWAHAGGFLAGVGLALVWPKGRRR
jgi:membrane associated rhomboid family serine protease